MSLVRRRLLTAVVVCALLVPPLYWAGASIGNTPWQEEFALLLRLNEEGRQIEQHHQQVLFRLERKSLIFKELRAGRLELLEAAAQFRDLAETWTANDWQIFRGLYPA